jgi:hypothetical protein
MNTQKPTLIHVIAWTTLASGIVNLFWGFILSGTALATVIGIFCVPLTILPTILGVFELIYAARLFSNPPQAIKPATNIAVLEIACLLAGNLFSMAVGILSLVFYNDTVVKDYFARLNGMLEPSPATPPAPASLSEPFGSAPPAGTSQDKPEPVHEAVPAPVEEPLAPPAEETPAKPKRTPRKVAKK